MQVAQVEESGGLSEESYTCLSDQILETPSEDKMCICV